MRADLTGSGACTSGSTARPGDATKRSTKRACGGAATTTTTSAEPGSLRRRLRAALRRQRGRDNRLVRVHVGDGRNADARRLDDVDGVDADARTELAGRRGVVSRHVDPDDGGDDAAIPRADAVALPPGGRNGRGAPRSADRTGGRGLLPCLDRGRNGGLPAGCRAGDARN